MIATANNQNLRPFNTLPPDGPESLRMLGIRPFPCQWCAKQRGCTCPADIESKSRCGSLVRWMHTEYPKLRQLFLGKKRAAHGGSSSEDGK